MVWALVWALVALVAALYIYVLWAVLKTGALILEELKARIKVDEADDDDQQPGT